MTKYLNGSDFESGLFYVCGPPVMVNAMKQLLKDELMISEDRIKMEFTGY